MGSKTFTGRRTYEPLKDIEARRGRGREHVGCYITRALQDTDASPAYLRRFVELERWFCGVAIEGSRHTLYRVGCADVTDKTDGGRKSGKK